MKQANERVTMPTLKDTKFPLLLPLLALVPTACATVKIQAPDKPIEINLNVKIEQELRIKLDREIEDLIADNPDVFS